MPEASTTPGIDAGRQTPAHEQLSRTLWLRKRGEVFRFLFDPAADPGLTLERIGQGGGVVRVAAAGAQGRRVDSGLMLVDGREGLAFCSAAEPMGLLRRLAGWAGGAIAATPALALLADAGAGPLTVDPADDAAAVAYVPDGEQVVYDQTLWDTLLEPVPATSAAALAATPPGERLWFWLAEDETEGIVPLIVQPVAWDPNHDRTNWLIDRNIVRGAGEGIGGTATICDDGAIQFLGPGLYPEMLQQLARWVAREHTAHPALGRLVDCQLLDAEGGTVDRVIADPALWADVARDPVPGTIRATASVLADLPVSGECWFWLAGGPAEPPFLHLMPIADDPDGVAFQADLPRLYRRFPNAFANAVSGVMRRVTAERLLFISHDARVQQFPAQVKALLDRYGAEFPSLRALVGTSLVQAGTGGTMHVIAAEAAQH